jgi:polyisoprenyl-phosphate glycosyltransferase
MDTAVAPMTSRSLSIVIACYRDAGSVREFYRRLTEVLPQVTPNYEIIYVNDASPDDAETILCELAAKDPHLVVINHTRNFGSQNAFLSGMRIARGDGIILMDGDLQDPPHLIPQLVEKWMEGYDVVYGRRVARVETLFRQYAYKVFYRLFRRLADVPIPVDAGDFGLIDRKVVKTLMTDFPEHSVFLRGLRAYTGYKNTGVDYVRDARFDGRSTNSLSGNIRWAKLAIFSFSKKPLQYISVLASSCVLTTCAIVILYLIVYFCSSTAPPPGWMTQFLAVLFLGSIQLVCFAILAEYLAHMYDELKKRPRYVIRDIVDNRPPADRQDDMVPPRET